MPQPYYLSSLNLEFHNHIHHTDPPEIETFIYETLPSTSRIRQFALGDTIEGQQTAPVYYNQQLARNMRELAFHVQTYVCGMVVQEWVSAIVGTEEGGKLSCLG